MGIMMVGISPLTLEPATSIQWWSGYSTIELPGPSLAPLECASAANLHAVGRGGARGASAGALMQPPSGEVRAPAESARNVRREGEGRGEQHSARMRVARGCVRLAIISTSKTQRVRNGVESVDV
eukprot:679507-Prymnesium_polylepis.1